MFGDLPPSSSVTFLRLLLPAACTISRPTSVEPVKATLSTSGWAASAAPAVSPKPGDDIHHALREARLLNQLAQPQGAERRLLGRLEHDRAARRQGRAEFPGGHQQRKVPGNDLPHHADRLAERVAEELAAGQ